VRHRGYPAAAWFLVGVLAGSGARGLHLRRVTSGERSQGASRAAASAAHAYLWPIEGAVRCHLASAARAV